MVGRLVGGNDADPSAADRHSSQAAGGVGERYFEKFASAAARATGSSPAFLLCVAAVAIWAASGPFLRFSENWQLVINTGTTIVTFLTQNTQNRDSVALQTKLDELIRTSQAENELIGIEKHRPRVGGAACQMRGGSPAGAGGAAPGADGEGVAPDAVKGLPSRISDIDLDIS